MITKYIVYVKIMGCSVVSVYNDEVIGKIGYPQIVLDDLSARDFKSSATLTNI